MSIITNLHENTNDYKRLLTLCEGFYIVKLGLLFIFRMTRSHKKGVEIPTKMLDTMSNKTFIHWKEIFTFGPPENIWHSELKSNWQVKGWVWALQKFSSHSIFNRSGKSWRTSVVPTWWSYYYRKYWLVSKSPFVWYSSRNCAVQDGGPIIIIVARCLYWGKLIPVTLKTSVNWFGLH